ncbi:MAG: AEC family transporter [Anaerolineae bacterium]
MTQFFSTIINVIAPILLVIGLGALWSWRFQPDRRTISSVIIYLFAPALALRGLINANLTGGEMFQVIGLVFGASILMALIGLAVARALGLDQREESALILSVILFNGANYGVPFNQFAYGQNAGEIAIVYFSISTIIANTLGVYLAARSTSGAASFGSIFRIPLIYTTLLGVVFNLAGVTLAQEGVPLTSMTIPLPISRVINLLADATIPAMLVLIGVQLVGSSVVGRVRPMLAAVGLRLIVSPMLAFLLAVALGMEGLMLNVGVTQLAMPTAVIASALATQFGGDAAFVTSVILVSTLASVITLSLLTVLLT